VNFLNVGPWELTVIIIIAILLVGPQRMVEITRSIGRMVAQLHRFSNEFTTTLQNEIMLSENAETGKESGRKPTGDHMAQSIAASIADIQAELTATTQETQRALQSIITGLTDDAAALGQAADIQEEMQTMVEETGRVIAGSPDRGAASEPDDEKPSVERNDD
jgi:sec-independent protein translocase protein TatB